MRLKVRATICANVAHQKVFVFSNYPQWRRRVRLALADVLTDAVFERVRRAPPRNFDEDNCRSINEAINELAIGAIDAKAALCDRFAAIFPFVRAFHGCRCETPASYLGRGILPADPQRSHEEARRIFRQKERLPEIFSEMHPYLIHNSGKVFFLLGIDRFFTGACAGYVFNGSEFLSGVANRLGEYDALTSKGQGMILECDIPTEDIPTDTIESLARLILTEIFRKYCHRKNGRAQGIGFWIPCALSRENILKVHFPVDE